MVRQLDSRGGGLDRECSALHEERRHAGWLRSARDPDIAMLVQHQRVGTNEFEVVLYDSLDAFCNLQPSGHAVASPADGSRVQVGLTAAIRCATGDASMLVTDTSERKSSVYPYKVTSQRFCSCERCSAHTAAKVALPCMPAGKADAESTQRVMNAQVAAA